MRAKSIRASLIFVCTSLFLFVPALGAQQETPSVLSRVQTVEDPELSDLIRVAIENYERPLVRPVPGASPDRLKIVQEVTESYARIKLLDEQIEQTKRKAETTTAAIRQEVLLARAELESKRIIEFSKLRQFMGVIPAHAFGRRSISELKTWLQFEVLGDRVIAYETLRPFGMLERNQPYSLAGLMPKDRVLDYIGGQLKKDDGLPIRIDIHATANGVAAAAQLESQIVELIRKGGAEMRAEVRRDPASHEKAVFTVECASDGLPGGSYDFSDTPGNPGGRLKGILDPNQMARQAEIWFLAPTHVPALVTVQCPQTDRAEADELVKAIVTTAERLGLAGLVEVTRNLQPVKDEELLRRMMQRREQSLKPGSQP